MRDSKEVGSHAIFEVHRNVKSKVDVLVIQRSRNGTSDTLMYIMLCMEWHVTGSLGGYFFFWLVLVLKKDVVAKTLHEIGPNRPGLKKTKFVAPNRLELWATPFDHWFLAASQNPRSWSQIFGFKKHQRWILQP